MVLSNNYGTAYRRRGPTQFERDTGFYSDSYDQPGPSHYSPPSSGGTHTSSGKKIIFIPSLIHSRPGFGGTERR